MVTSSVTDCGLQVNPAGTELPRPLGKALAQCRWPWRLPRPPPPPSLILGQTVSPALWPGSRLAGMTSARLRETNTSGAAGRGNDLPADVSSQMRPVSNSLRRHLLRISQTHARCLNGAWRKLSLWDGLRPQDCRLAQCSFPMQSHLWTPAGDVAESFSIQVKASRRTMPILSAPILEGITCQ